MFILLSKLFKRETFTMNSNNTINGISISGNNISISNGKIIVDGKEYKPDDDKRLAITHVTVQGSVVKLEVSQGNVTVTGNTGDIECDQGNVTVGGSVTGNIECDMGNIDIQGSVSGSASADMGNVKIYNK